MEVVVELPHFGVDEILEARSFVHHVAVDYVGERFVDFVVGACGFVRPERIDGGVIVPQFRQRGAQRLVEFKQCAVEVAQTFVGLVEGVHTGSPEQLMQCSAKTSLGDGGEYVAVNPITAEQTGSTDALDHIDIHGRHRVVGLLVDPRGGERSK